MLFVKDQNPEKPNYFLFQDNIDTELPSDWNIWCLAESMELGNNTIEAHFKGKYDVNLDVYSLIPDKNIVTGAYGPTESVYGFYRQKLYQLQQNSGGNYMVLLYPRLRNEKQPEVKAWGISGTCIRTNTWTHYVVLSNHTSKRSGGRRNVPGESRCITQGWAYEINNVALHRRRESPQLDGLVLENDSGGPTSVRVNIKTRNVTGSGNGEARYTRLMLPNKQRPIDLTINGQEVDFPFTNDFVEFMVLTGQHNFKLAF